MEIIDQQSWQPVSVVSGELGDFINKHPGIQVIDRNRSNLEELFLLRHPRYRFDKSYQGSFQNFFKHYDYPSFGHWFYFPWSNILVRYLPEALHLELRTGRNKNLITETEQLRFYYSTVTILGLSVGSHVVAALVMTGGVKRFKLADPDNLSGDNLNRIRTSFQNVGTKKIVVAARQIFEINPYSEVELYPGGINDENAEQLVSGSDMIVEETDNPYWKFRSRELARECRLPVLMGTDNGDGVIVDIERYDLDKNTLILNGLVGKLTAEGLKSMAPKDLPKIAGKIAGANLVVPRMLQSVAAVGETLYSWPQLGTAANMCGSIIAYLTRRLLIGDRNIKSGRYSVNLDAVFESDYGRKSLSRKINLLKFMWKMKK